MTTTSGPLFRRPDAVQVVVLSGRVVDGVACTLSDAIRAANTNVPTGGCAAGDDRDGKDLIDLRTDVGIELPDNTDINGCPNGLPPVTSRIQIHGNGHTVSRTSSPEASIGFRLFDSTQGDLTLDHVTIRDALADACVGAGINGVVTLIDSVVTNNRALNRGGGVAGTSVQLIRTAVTDNRGLGVYVVGTLRVSESVIARNRGSGAGPGGGLEVHGTAVLENTTIADNEAGITGLGGGIFADGDVTLFGSTVSGNFAGGDLGFGGGIFLYRGTLTVVDGTITGNIARGSGLGAPAGGSGGGIFSSTLWNNSGPSGVVTLIHSTVTGNSAVGRNGEEMAGTGGGLVADQLLLTNSIIANNVATIEGTGDCAAFGAVTFTGLNLIGDGGCDAAAEGQVTGDPMLGALADNGGPTLTQMPQAGSPVIDRIPRIKGRCDGAPDVRADQRGVKRPPAKGGCDIGAVEVGPDDALVSTLSARP